ncbi:hypothetical protein [Nocardia sp. NPDC058705]|uniref:hypothetical protein n=1 Tax=Nocardia sp. NPDC058705 TaxID=3346609 RepID=UPI00368F4095
MSRRKARPGRYRSLHVAGYRSASHMPILWVFAALVGGVIFLLIVLTIANMASADPAATPTATTITQPSAAPAAPSSPPPTTTTPPPQCYPFQPSC